MTDRITKDTEEFNKQGAGWFLRSILHLTININKFNRITVGSFIETPPPPFIAKKRPVLNANNID